MSPVSYCGSGGMKNFDPNFLMPDDPTRVIWWWVEIFVKAFEGDARKMKYMGVIDEPLIRWWPLDLG